MSTQPRWTQDDLARAEHLFRTSTLPLTAIALECGIPRSTLQLRAEANGWRRCPEWRPMGPPSRIKAVLSTSVAAGERRRALALRALAAAERQMADIEARAARGPMDVIERSARRACSPPPSASCANSPRSTRAPRNRRKQPPSVSVIAADAARLVGVTRDAGARAPSTMLRMVPLPRKRGRMGARL